MSMFIVSAATSVVTIDGLKVDGLQSLEYKVERRQVDVESISTWERIGVESGFIKVTGTLAIRSLNKTLDDLLLASALERPRPFNLVAELKLGDELVKKITFDECYVDNKSFQLGAEGVGLTVYDFTATRVREE